jgi:hypothetical protein
VLATLAVIAALACGSLTAPAVPTGDVSTIVAATFQAMTQPVDASLAAPTGLSVSYSNVRLVIPVGLASGTTNSTTTDVEFPYVNPSGGPMPQHTKIILNGYPLQGTMFEPQITVFRAAEYAQYGPLTQSMVSALQGLQYVAGQPLPKGLPAGDFDAQTQAIDFPNGRGIRFLTQFDQAPLPVNNHELFYYFQGLTTGGSDYVQAILPLQVPFLAPDANPASPLPPGGVAFDLPEIQIYFDAVAEKLNATPPGTFQPTLTSLDALIQSLQVSP